MFPDPRESDEQGLLCYGGDLRVATLVEAYSKGVFPWPQEGLPILWFSPKNRGIIDFSDLHIAKSLQKTVKHNPFKITHNTAFEQVVSACRTTARKHEKGTWILPEMVSAYIEMHKAGYAHSFEAWGAGGALAGGIYGLRVGNYFSAESMFYRESNASKLCLLKLIEWLQNSEHLTWMDVQMVTPVTEQLGARYISQDEFLMRIGLR